MTHSRSGDPLGDVALEEWAVAFDSLGREDLPPTVPPGLADELARKGGLLRVAEAAKRVGVTQVAVRHWIRRGQVVAIRDGRSWLVGEQSLYDCELARRAAPGWDDEARARRGGDDESP